MLIRLFFLILLCLAGLFIHPLIVTPFIFLYAMRWYAPELLLLAALLDGYFHAVSSWPLYMLGVFALVLGAELTKKYLRFI